MATQKPHGPEVVDAIHDQILAIERRITALVEGDDPVEKRTLVELTKLKNVFIGARTNTQISRDALKK